LRFEEVIVGYSIAVAGKGGTGKTTMAGFLIKYLVEKAKTPVLAVDADANANLNEVLGLDLAATLGDAREEMKKSAPIGMTKEVFMEMKLQQAVIEASGFDLIVMGRPEGAGCYCAANTLLKGYLEKLMANYRFVVIDNEAGMEHISRLTTSNVDVLLVVTDPTRRGIQAAGRIVDLTDELGLSIHRKLVLVNQAKKGQWEAVGNLVQDHQLDLIGMVPEDPEVREFDLAGRPTTQLGGDSVALAAAFAIFDKILMQT
jgi:CO dehydrogenase maturation factor